MAVQPNSFAQAKRDSFGCCMGDLDDNRTIASSSLTFHRKRAFNSPPGQVSMAANRGHLLGLSVHGGHRRRIFHPHHSAQHEFSAGSIYLRNLGDAYKADLEGSFDFVLVEVSPAALGELAESADLRGVNDLREANAEHDPVLASLAHALFAAPDDARDKSTLFIDQISTALGIHIVRAYGNGRAESIGKRRRLSRRAEALATELISSRISTDISVDEVALACNLSRGAFIRAFRETTGKTPHQWLIERRVEKASGMLLSTDMTLAEISMACGFADQPHFTRTFSASTGATPGAWRRQMAP